MNHKIFIFPSGQIIENLHRTFYLFFSLFGLKKIKNDVISKLKTHEHIAYIFP